jgi:hypothetical protein
MNQYQAWNTEPKMPAERSVPPLPETVASRIWTKSDLQALEFAPDLCWVFDFTSSRIWWANAAEVAAWGAGDLDELAARDLSDMSGSVRQRLADCADRLSGGEVVDEQWTLFPLGIPLTLERRCHGLVIDGGFAMLVVARRGGPAFHANELRALEAFLASGLKFSHARSARHAVAEPVASSLPRADALASDESPRTM